MLKESVFGFAGCGIAAPAPLPLVADDGGGLGCHPSGGVSTPSLAQAVSARHTTLCNVSVGEVEKENPTAVSAQEREKRSLSWRQH